MLRVQRYSSLGCGQLECLGGHQRRGEAEVLGLAERPVLPQQAADRRRIGDETGHHRTGATAGYEHDGQREHACEQAAIFFRRGVVDCRLQRLEEEAPHGLVRSRGESGGNRGIVAHRGQFTKFRRQRTPRAAFGASKRHERMIRALGAVRARVRPLDLRLHRTLHGRFSGGRMRRGGHSQSPLPWMPIRVSSVAERNSRR